MVTQLLRIGCEPIAENTVYIEGLKDQSAVELVEDIPGRLFEMLQDEALDCALLPVLSCAQTLLGHAIPGFGVAVTSKQRIHEELSPELAAQLARTPTVDLWHRYSDDPFVQSLWMARPRAPLPRLRACIARAYQHGLASAITVPQGVQYRIGGVEMDTVRTLIELAVQHGVLPEGTELHFC